MLTIIMKSIYFFLPAYFANMAPILFKRLPLLNKPINKTKFGENKTWRGLVFATFLGAVVFWLQRVAYQEGFTNWALIDYTDFSILFGVLLGFGAIFGDLVESYYKRKSGFKPGESWLPWDQLDFVLGGLIFSFFIYVPPAEVVLVLLLVSPLLHIVVNYLGYLMKFKKNKF